MAIPGAFLCSNAPWTRVVTVAGEIAAPVNYRSIEFIISSRAFPGSNLDVSLSRARAAYRRLISHKKRAHRGPLCASLSFIVTQSELANARSGRSFRLDSYDEIVCIKVNLLCERVSHLEINPTYGMLANSFGKLYR